MSHGNMLLQAYAKARVQGTNEIGSVLLSISSELLTFDFKETFVNAFEVRLRLFSPCCFQSCASF